MTTMLQQEYRAALRDTLDLLGAAEGEVVGGEAEAGMTLARIAIRARLETLDALAQDLASPPPREKTRTVSPETRAEIAARAAATRVAQGGGEWTEPRLELLRQRYPDARTLREVWEAINALPGNAIGSIDSMRQKAMKIGLKRARSMPPEHIDRMNAARLAKQAERRAEAAEAAPPDHSNDATEMVPDAPPAKAPQPANLQAPLETSPPPPALKPITPDWTAPGQLSPSAEREAVELLHAGRGARALREEFGGDLEWWQQWCAAQRGRRAA